MAVPSGFCPGVAGGGAVLSPGDPSVLQLPSLGPWGALLSGGGSSGVIRKQAQALLGTQKCTGIFFEPLPGTQLLPCEPVACSAL